MQEISRAVYLEDVLFGKQDSTQRVEVSLYEKFINLNRSLV